MSSAVIRTVIETGSRGVIGKITAKGLPNMTKIDIAIESKFKNDENFRLIVKLCVEELVAKGPSADVPEIISNAESRHRHLIERRGFPLAKGTDSKCHWCGEAGHWYIMCDGFHEALKEKAEEVSKQVAGTQCDIVPWGLRKDTSAYKSSTILQKLDAHKKSGAKVELIRKKRPALPIETKDQGKGTRA